MEGPTPSPPSTDDGDEPAADDAVAGWPDVTSDLRGGRPGTDAPAAPASAAAAGGGGPDASPLSDDGNEPAGRPASDDGASGAPPLKSTATDNAVAGWPEVTSGRRSGGRSKLILSK